MADCKWYPGGTQRASSFVGLVCPRKLLPKNGEGLQWFTEGPHGGAKRSRTADLLNAIHMVAGLLLPIWKRLPNESTRVYRLQTDTGERLIGRKVSPAWAANATATGTTALSPEEAFAALMDGRTILDLAEGLQLRRARVMGVNRIELTGFTETMRYRLKAYGLFGEIISWKFRLFVPTDTSGPATLAKLLDRFPIERIAEREAA